VEAGGARHDVEMSTLRYRLAVPRPESHLVEVELTIDDAASFGDRVVLEMAAWAPGSYLIRDYARFVRDLEVSDEGGARLAVVQRDKRSFAIERGGAGRLTVRYQVYGHELTVRTNHIDRSHALLHGPAVYLFPGAALDARCEVSVVPPAGRGWSIHTGLREAGGLYHAAGVDELLDCPIHLGAVEERIRRAAGKPLRLAVWGDLAARRFELDQLADDLVAICEAHAARLGGVPYDDYTFVLMLAPASYGGLEHRSSSINLHTPFCLGSSKSYHELLELLSHEYFHAWNGKRLHPEAFARFDYGAENHTRCLWVVEGLTSYYDRLTTRLAGRLPVATYLAKLAEEWGRLLAVPGRRRQSLEESSLNAWQKLYKPDESNLNTTVSYYLKGGITALVLDLELRQRSGGARGLDDVLRHLWQRCAVDGRGYPEDVQPLFEEGAGMELGDFFARFVRGTEDPALGPALASVGLELRGGHDVRAEDGGDPPWLGVFLLSGGLRIAGVPDDGPAAAAGLSPGDDLIALDGYQLVGEPDLRARLFAYRPGASVELALFRRGHLEHIRVELGTLPFNRWEIGAPATVDETARAAFRAWLGADHPGPRFTAVASVPVGV
jgi:predicted metalloprotease with PDZ domain